MSDTDKFEMGTGLAHELTLAFRRHKWTKGMVKKLTRGEVLGEVATIITGEAKIVTCTHLIDTNAMPITPKGYSIKMHVGHGKMVWSPEDLPLVYRHPSQKQKGVRLYVEAGNLIETLGSEPTMNATVYDHLISNPFLLPEEWEGLRIYFPDTIFVNSHSQEVFRSLYFFEGEWQGGFESFGCHFTYNYVTLLDKARM